MEKGSLDKSGSSSFSLLIVSERGIRPAKKSKSHRLSNP